MSYTVEMNRYWLPRLILLLTLVFAQALYAGHAVQHSNGGNLSDCSVCLQVASGDDVHIASHFQVATVTDILIFPNQPVQTCFSVNTSYAQHSRAPPVSLD